MPYKYAVIGTGAIGGYYGGKLAHAGNGIHFLLHSDYRYVKENGLKIDSIDGDLVLPHINAYNKTSDMPQCDVILIGLKSINNRLLKELLPPIIHKDSVVILIQNGLGIEEDLQKDFPDLNIAGGLAFICSAKTGQGHISHLDYGKLNLGSYSTPVNILDQVCSDLNNAGIDANVLELELARWMKLVWNIPYNGMTVALNTSTDKLMDHPATAQLIKDMMLEVIHAANCVGNDRFSIPEQFADEMLDMTKKMTPYSPSMKLDFDAKRPLEIEYIYSRPIQVAKAAGYEMSQVSMLEKQLKFIESQY
jgi:2-dehydropantoate 2-reductase